MILKKIDSYQQGMTKNVYANKWSGMNKLKHKIKKMLEKNLV